MRIGDIYRKMFIQGCAWAVFTIVKYDEVYWARTKLWHEGQHRAVYIYIYILCVVCLTFSLLLHFFVSLLVLFAGGGCTIFKLHHINIIS